jgi:preprotein translocase subunit SecG
MYFALVIIAIVVCVLLALFVLLFNDKRNPLIYPSPAY